MSEELRFVSAVLPWLRSTSCGEPVNYMGPSFNKGHMKVQYFISLCLQILWSTSMFCFSVEEFVLLQSLSVIKEWFPRCWQMPALPLLLRWGSWNCDMGLFLQCPHPRCLWTGLWTLSCKTKFGSSQGRNEGKESVGKVLARTSVSSRMIRGMSLESRSLLSLLLPQYPSSFYISDGHDKSSWTCQVNLSWWVFATILLSVGTHLLHATSEIILTASFVWQICLKFSLWFLFLLILEFNNMRKEESTEYQSLKLCCWGCRPSVGFLKEQCCADEDPWELSYTRWVH